MKIVSIVARYLLAVAFVVFGLDKFVRFIPEPAMPAGPAGQFYGAMLSSHFIWVVGFFEVAPSLLLLVNRYVPLALTLLGPIVVNILLFNLLMNPTGIPIAIVVTVLWLLIFLPVRASFSGIFVAKA